MKMGRSAQATTTDTTKPAKIASPPALGSGSVFSLRALGLSSQPTRTAKVRMPGMKRQVNTSAVRKISATISAPPPARLAMPIERARAESVSSIDSAVYDAGVRDGAGQPTPEERHRRREPK